MKSSVILKIEEKLGKEVYCKPNSIMDLRKIPDDLIQDLRQVVSEVSELNICMYLKSICDHTQSVHLEEFVEDVICEGKDHKVWGSIVNLAVDLPLDKLVTMGSDEFIELLVGDGNVSDVVRVLPKKARTYSPVSSGGALIYLKKDHDYRELPPKGLVIVGDKAVEPVLDINIAYRRNLSARLYNKISGSGSFDKVFTGLDLLRFSFPGIDDRAFSIDAVKAANGLMTEIREGLGANDIAGFTATDAQYR
ncbi:hypothetical protein HCH_04399 [Hahella chejuensis KCTC 2396]|uniref:Uncharacterized protein n=1 Tax=Hahella chejuensis (strain KCTC 2396) TaxID=349521 RepID=Q2SE19_HAHCH|nr:hypothetical protein [Hahella chejuensis]ABC31105.1 hypothetical protein HCH_04399 [Hahella chejuensis KCTC 2396]